MKINNRSEQQRENLRPEVGRQSVYSPKIAWLMALAAAVASLVAPTCHSIIVRRLARQSENCIRCEFVFFCVIKEIDDTEDRETSDTSDTPDTGAAEVATATVVDNETEEELANASAFNATAEVEFGRGVRRGEEDATGATAGNEKSDLSGTFGTDTGVNVSEVADSEESAGG
jgi:hypothetical protein